MGETVNTFDSSASWVGVSRCEIESSNSKYSKQNRDILIWNKNKTSVRIYETTMVVKEKLADSLIRKTETFIWNYFHKAT